MLGGVAKLMEQRLDPSCGLLGTLGVNMVGEAPEVFAGVIEVQSFGRLAEALIEQVPYPDGSIDHGENFFGPNQTLIHGLLLDSCPEIKDIGLGRDGDHFFFDQHAASASIGHPVFESVNDRTFNLLPGDSF